MGINLLVCLNPPTSRKVCLILGQPKILPMFSATRQKGDQQCGMNSNCPNTRMTPKRRYASSYRFQMECRQGSLTKPPDHAASRVSAGRGKTPCWNRAACLRHRLPPGLCQIHFVTPATWQVKQMARILTLWDGLTRRFQRERITPSVKTVLAVHCDEHSTCLVMARSGGAGRVLVPPRKGSGTLTLVQDLTRIDPSLEISMRLFSARSLQTRRMALRRLSGFAFAASNGVDK